jgi:hypothetical protein
VPPFINGFYRKRGWGDRETWHGGDAFDDSKGWPEADVHNAREAAWARRHATDQVLNRLDSAHARVVELVDTLTPDELADERYRQYIAGNTFDHYVEHLPELR